VLSVAADKAVTWNFSNNTQSNIVFNNNMTLNTTEGSNNYTICGVAGANMNCSRLVFTINTKSPNITIQSPTNQTYNLSSVVFSVTSDESVTYNYTNATNSNIALSGNTTLDLRAGSHNFTLCATDISHVMNCTRLVFAVDTTAPNITITSPTNTTYNLTAVVLSVTADETITAWNFSNNTQSNIAFNNNMTLNTTEGSNNMTICGSDNLYMNCSRLVFTIDTTSPVFTINNPINTTYLFNFTSLNWTSDNDDNHTIMILNGDRLDTSHLNISNINMKEGSNQLELSINDTLNRTTITGINFTLNSKSPNATILSPTNQTYNLSSVVFSITSDESVTYNYTNATNSNIALSGNTTLDLRQGTHNFTLCATDISHVMNCTRLWFSVDSKAPNITIQSPTNITYNLTAVVLSVTADETITTWNFSNNTSSNVAFNNNMTLNVTEGSNNLTICGSDGVFLNCSKLY